VGAERTGRPEPWVHLHLTVVINFMESSDKAKIAMLVGGAAVAIGAACCYYFAKKGDDSKKDTPTTKPKHLRKMKKADVDREIKEGRMILIFGNNVYDATEFKKEHPGGPDKIENNVNLQDVSEKFNEIGHSANAK